MKNFKIDDDQEFIENDGVWVHYKKGITYAKIPDSLFKYYSINEYNLDAIKNGYFFLSNPKEFNDPFDCSRNFIIENRKDFIDGQYVPSLNNVKNIGVSCFTENGLNPLMWGHYTKYYQGFTIKLKSNFEILNREYVNDVKIIKVIYSNNPNPIQKSHPLSKDYQFIVKLKDWEYENEIRLIVEKNNDLNKIFYNKEDVEEFCFGYNFSFKNELLKIIETNYPGIPVYTVGPDAREFKLNKVRLIKGTVEDGFEFIEKRRKYLFGF